MLPEIKSFENFDLFVQRMEETMQNATSSLDKEISHLAEMVQANGHFLDNYQSPAAVGRFEQLAKRVSEMATENSDQKSRIAKVSEELRGYSTKFRFPSELMGQIVERAPSERTALVSKETRTQTLIAYKGLLRELNIKTGDEAIDFAEEFGPHLTYMDVTGIRFTDLEQVKAILQLFKLEPNHLTRLNILPR